RNVLGLSDANSTEMDSDTKNPVIATMADQVEKIKNKNYGATMRLGAYPCLLKDGSVAALAYGKKSISERHRHRYEVNNAYIEPLEKAGFVFSGSSPDGRLMEIAELSKNEHPFYLGTQFHPEFKSRPLTPHPLFYAFVKACISKKK
ncbi:MAG: CTP synthase, partial [Candidatus Nomurabacteria bacterium GW2011_GWA1_40_8]